jgi:transposase
VELFVACWGASSFTYAEGTLSQASFDWTQSHIRAFRYFGCIPHLLVPDNLKAGVTKADWYDPERNPLYTKLAEHYQTAILPARPKKPRDKAVVESAVGYAQRFILARLRNRMFYSLAEVNAAVRELVDELNDTLMQQFRVSRRQRFEQLDKPYALPLPGEDFPYVALKQGAKVNRDYHLEYQKHYYSVPHALCGQRVDVRQTNSVVEVYHEGLRIASHLVSYKHYGYTTTPEHMPANHRFVKGWSPGYFLNQATKIGPSMVEVVKVILGRRSHPEVGFRSALGVLNLARHYPQERLERAAGRAVHYHQVSKKSIQSILDQGLDKQPLPAAREPQQTTLFHENIRGASYYTQSQEVPC